MLHRCRHSLDISLVGCTAEAFHGHLYLGSGEVGEPLGSIGLSVRQAVVAVRCAIRFA